MSGVKEHLFEVENEAMRQWMRQTFNIPNDKELDEESDGWHAMVEMYHDMKNAESYEASVEWYKEHPHEEIYDSFRGNLSELKDMVSQNMGPFYNVMMHRMAYAHAVTLFEAMVGELLKSLVMNDTELLANLVNGLAGDSSKKYNLKQIADYGVNGLIVKILSEELYHNPVTVKKYVDMISGRVMPSTHMAKMSTVTKIRHDVAHRNGKTVDDEYHELNSEAVIDCIKTIELFSKDVFLVLTDGFEEF